MTTITELLGILWSARQDSVWKMSEEILLYRVRLNPDIHSPTGRTSHYDVRGKLPAPAELQIVQYSNDAGFYLLYCDEHGTELTDTWHETIDKALSQAHWEFGIQPDEWELGNRENS